VRPFPAAPVIILDTNVLSALMQAVPARPVVEWLDRQPADAIWLTSVTVFEAAFGIGLLPRGRRREALGAAFERFLAGELGGRVLDLDRAAASAAASLAAARRSAGRPVDLRDTLIAGIAVARRARLATRNVRDFADLDVEVLNPWETA
jgi:predicted nucleic acid-binding protein